jgi:hypothetical protein
MSAPKNIPEVHQSGFVPLPDGSYAKLRKGRHNVTSDVPGSVLGHVVKNGEPLAPSVTALAMVAKADPEPTKSEKAIHNQILAYCKAQGWLVIHSSMASKTTTTIGTPDFIALLPQGRVLFVEAKTAKGKLSPAQIEFTAKAGELGHVVHVVRSVTEFRNAVNFGVV